MARKKWFRVYHGLATDMSLAVAAQHAQLTRSEMLALWLCLLDHASRSEPAGSIATFDHDEAALVLMIENEKVASALKALRQRKKNRRTSAHHRLG